MKYLWMSIVPSLLMSTGSVDSATSLRDILQAFDVNQAQISTVRYVTRRTQITEPEGRRVSLELQRRELDDPSEAEGLERHFLNSPDVSYYLTQVVTDGVRYRRYIARSHSVNNFEEVDEFDSIEVFDGIILRQYSPKRHTGLTKLETFSETNDAVRYRFGIFGTVESAVSRHLQDLSEEQLDILPNENGVYVLERLINPNDQPTDQIRSYIEIGIDRAHGLQVNRIHNYIIVGKNTAVENRRSFYEYYAEYAQDAGIFFPKEIMESVYIQDLIPSNLNLYQTRLWELREQQTVLLNTIKTELLEIDFDIKEICDAAKPRRK